VGEGTGGNEPVSTIVARGYPAGKDVAMTARTHGRIRIEDGAKRVRVMLGGETVADTKAVKLVWEKPYYPTYYFPAADVRADLLVDTGEVHATPSRGQARIHTIKAGSREAPAAVRWYVESDIDELTGHVTFDWKAMDSWFEEDEEVYVHARDPYTRVDILQSSRRVEVFVDGVEVADSHQPRLLFETGLPVRYYLPKTDVRMDLLTPTDLHTDCPYKGVASYYSVTVGDAVHENLVWWYPFPVEESSKIAGYVSFYNEKVDIVVDGVPLERPQTKFS
jgi:uncharacterized protein (DUF427 family)